MNRRTKLIELNMFWAIQPGMSNGVRWLSRLRALHRAASDASSIIAFEQQSRKASRRER